MKKRFGKLIQDKIQPVVKKNLKFVDFFLDSDEDEKGNCGELPFNSKYMAVLDIESQGFLPVANRLPGFHEFSQRLKTCFDPKVVFCVYPGDPDIGQIIVSQKAGFLSKMKAVCRGTFDFQSIQRLECISEGELKTLLKRKGKTVSIPYGLKVKRGKAEVPENFQVIFLFHWALNFAEGSTAGLAEITFLAYDKEYKAQYLSPLCPTWFHIGGEWYHNLYVPEMAGFSGIENNEILLTLDSGRLHIISSEYEDNLEISPNKEESVKFSIPSHDGKVNTSIPVEVKLKLLPRHAQGLEKTAGIANGSQAAQNMPVAESVLSVRESIFLRNGESIMIPVRPAELRSARIIPQMILLPKPCLGVTTQGGKTLDFNNYGFSLTLGASPLQISILGSEKKVIQKYAGKSQEFVFKNPIETDNLSDELIRKIPELQETYLLGLKGFSGNAIAVDNDVVWIGRSKKANIRLMTGDDIWNIHASNLHALIVKNGQQYLFYNVSRNFPTFVVRKSMVARIEPLERQKYTGLLEALKKEDLDTSRRLVAENSSLEGRLLKDGDTLIVGNKVFRFSRPGFDHSVFEPKGSVATNKSKLKGTSGSK